MVFCVEDEPGALVTVLRHFAGAGVNITALFSRPVRGSPFVLSFYCEICGHAADPSVATVLEGVRQCTTRLRVLGSFPAASEW